MTFVEPLEIFFTPGTPGVVTATINGSTVNGTLEAYLAETLEGALRSDSPAFYCIAADLPTINQGDTLQVGSTAYKLREARIEAFDPIAVLYLNNP